MCISKHLFMLFVRWTNLPLLFLNPHTFALCTSECVCGFLFLFCFFCVRLPRSDSHVCHSVVLCGRDTCKQCCCWVLVFLGFFFFFKLITWNFLPFPDALCCVAPCVLSLMSRLWVRLTMHSLITVFVKQSVNKPEGVQMYSAVRASFLTTLKYNFC